MPLEAARANNRARALSQDYDWQWKIGKFSDGWGASRQMIQNRPLKPMILGNPPWLEDLRIGKSHVLMGLVHP